MLEEIIIVKKHPNYIKRKGTKLGKFIVIEDLGYLKPKPDSKVGKSYIKIQCILCNKIHIGQYRNFIFRPKVCCQPKPKRTDDEKRIYHILDGMISRCHNPNIPSFKYYGDNGIEVCSDWRENRKSFLEWAKNNDYQHDLSIDRIDNNKGYCPENCRWVNKETQSRNRKHVLSIDQVRNVKKLLLTNQTHSEISKRLGIKKSRIAQISMGRTWIDIE